MKKVLVTGARGWIGKYAVEILREKGYQVQALLGDLLEKPKFLPMATHLLHLAWITTPVEYWESPENVQWFESSLRLFQEFKEDGGQRIVVAGTCAEITGGSLYGKSKNALRKVLESYSDVTGVSSAWGRIFYLYGPHEKPERLVSSSIISLLQKREVFINHPSQMLDILHVYDVASALVSILDSDVKGTIEIGTGNPDTTIRIVQIISEILGCPELVKANNLPSYDRIACNPHRLMKEAGWTPKYNLHTGLEHTIEWWKNNTE